MASKKNKNINKKLNRQTGNSRRVNAKLDSIFAARNGGTGVRVPSNVEIAGMKRLNAFNNAMNDKRRKKSLGAGKVLNLNSKAGRMEAIRQGDSFMKGTGKRSKKGNSVKPRGGKGK